MTAVKERVLQRCRPLPADERLEGGFTVLELVVVLAVIAALMAIAVPSFLSARSTTQEHAAQADLRTALEAVNTVYIDAQSFGNVRLVDLATAEPRLTWNDKTTRGPGTLAVLTPAVVTETNTPAIGIVVQSGDGTCWYAFQTDNDAPLYGTSPARGDACDATQPAVYAGSQIL